MTKNLRTLATTVPAARPGWATTEFWLVVIANVLTQAGALPVPTREKWLVMLATVTGYALSRGLAKQNTP